MLEVWELKLLLEFDFSALLFSLVSSHVPQMIWEKPEHKITYERDAGRKTSAFTSPPPCNVTYSLIAIQSGASAHR
jgi:hypothetical protein